MNHLRILSVVILVLIIVANISAQSVYLVVTDGGDSIIAKSADKCQLMNFVTGNHWEDVSFEWKQKQTFNFWKAGFKNLNRSLGSGKIGKHRVIDAGSCPALIDLNSSYRVDITKPDEYILFCKGKFYDGKKSKIYFDSYFQAREFPMFFIHKGNFAVYQKPFNKDSIQIIYAWSDSSDIKALPNIMVSVEKSLNNVAKLAPKYWKKYLQNFGGAQYSLIVFIDKTMGFGIEKTNSPFVVINNNKYSYLAESVVYHEVSHSLNGRSIVGKGYTEKDGKYYPSGLLSFNEGLINLMSLRYIPQEHFANHLSSVLYRAKLDYGINDIAILPYCSKQETYYSKGYCYWTTLIGAGFNPDKFHNLLFEKILINKKFPVVANFDDVLKWLSLYDKNIGRLAKKISSKEYLGFSFAMLEKYGWSPVPLYEVPEWDSLYVGPYPIKERYPTLPNDIFQKNGVTAKYLINNDKSKSDLKPNNSAMNFIKNNPGGESLVELSDGTIEKLPNRLFFFDKTPYFMHGKIELNEKNKKFWSKLNFYIQ